MSRHDSPLADVYSSGFEARSWSDDLLRPCLRRAFPLPGDGGATEERFRQLLNALAKRRAAEGSVAGPLAAASR